MNKIILMGRLTKDPELRYTNTNQVPVAGFSMAVDRRRIKGKDKETDFFDVVTWQATAEFVTKHFTKGQQICVEGRLQQRSWTDKATGATRYAVEVIAENVYFAGYKKDDTQSSYVDQGADFDPYAA